MNIPEWIAYAIDEIRMQRTTKMETNIASYTITAYRVPSGDSYYIRIDIK